MNNTDAPRYRELMPGCLDLRQNNHAHQHQPHFPEESSIMSPRQQEVASVLIKMNHSVSSTGYYLTSPSIMSESPTFMSPTYPMIQQKQVFTFDQHYESTSAPCNTTSSWHTPRMNATVQQNINNFSAPWNHPSATMSSPPSVQNYSEQPVLMNPSTNFYVPQSHVSQPTQRQPFTPKENMPGFDNSNKLRSAIFDKILGSFPKLQRLMVNSSQRIKQEQGTYSDCSFNMPTRNSLASDIMDEENDMGYCSFNDHSPINSVQHSPASTAQESSSLNQILEDVLNCYDDLKDLKDLVSDIDENDQIVPSQHVTVKNPNSRPKPKGKTVKCESVPKKFQCMHCDKCFATRANLNTHIRCHNGERPHRCHYCGKCFTQKSTLRTHIRIHTGERPYKCSDCPKAFTDYSTYTKHCRTHTGERPYTCDICNKGFAQSGNMIRHRQMHFKD